MRLTATTLPLVCFAADASGVGAGATAGVEAQAPQAGSAPQPGSQPAPQSGSPQQPVQLDRLWQFFFALWMARRRSRIGVPRQCFFAGAAQVGSQQPAPASQAGSAQPLPAPQAGSAQPLPAPQPGSQQPLPALQSASPPQQLVQPVCRFLQANRPFRPPKRSCFFFRQLRPAPQLGSQQLDPASHAGSAQPLPAPQAGSAHPPPAPQPGSQQLPASQPGSQHEVQPLWPSILLKSSNPND